ncbi:hypothetical protein AX16_003879 [Volvariella volvacea WC 439]|nr:hypothetical protein AX16_003879 [Volvariella volvacea WC 439]
MPSVTGLVVRGLGDILPESPPRGHDLVSEMECYALPYGALGFVSHVLTYWTIGCLCLGRKPFFPFLKLDYGLWGLIWCGLGLALSTGMAIKTVTNCKNTWQLLVIAVWKLFMSLLSGFTAVHVAILIRLGKRDRIEWNEMQEMLTTALAWIVVYIPGMITGMTGLMSLVVQNWEDRGVYKLTIGFYTIVGFGLVFGLLVGIIAALADESSATVNILASGAGSLTMGTIYFTVLAAFYSDWALGMMTDNIVGTPSSDTASFYWTYWIAKRLPMLSCNGIAMCVLGSDASAFVVAMS